MAKSFGGVEQYGKRGKWCIRFELDGKRYRIASIPIANKWHPMSRALANEALKEIRDDIRRGVEPIAAVAPYMQRSSLLATRRRYEDYLEVQRRRADQGQLSRKRYEELAGHLSRGKLAAIADRPLHAVDYAALEELQLALLEEGRAAKTVHHVLADVRTFLRFCADRGWVDRVPRIPTTQLEEYEPTIPSREEQQARLEGIPEAARGYFLARGLLGIRHQEALRAEVSDYVRRDSGDELSIRGKGKRFRRLPVPAELSAWLRLHTPPLAEAGTPLFLNPKTGAAWSTSSLIRTWRAMERELGLPHIKPNEALRHCFGTRTAERLIRDGMSRSEAQGAVMRVMGHTSLKTSDRYVKLAAGTLRGVIE